MVVGSTWGKATRPIYLIDMGSGELLHVIRVGKKPWARIAWVDNNVGYAEHSLSPDERRLFIAVPSPAAVIVDLDSFEEIWEPYLASWWFWHRPRYMKKFERIGGALDLMKKKLLDKVLGTTDWVRMCSTVGGGFVSNRYVLTGGGEEARMYDLKSGELIAKEENPYVLRGLVGMFRGSDSRIGVLQVSKVKVPPTPFIIATNIRVKYKASGYLHAPSLSSGMSVDPYFGDPHKLYAYLVRVSREDFYFLPYDFMVDEVLGWVGFREDGWPIPLDLFGKRLRVFAGRHAREIFGDKLRRVLVNFASYAVDPRGRFVVLLYDVKVRFAKKGFVASRHFPLVVWLDGRSGRVIHRFFAGFFNEVPFFAYVLPSGVTLVYTSGAGVLVFDFPSFRFLKSFRMRGEVEDRVYGGFARFLRRTGRSFEARDYFHHEITVSPDLRYVAFPFGFSFRYFERSGILRRDETRAVFYEDASRYFGLGEGVRRELRTMYVVVADWEGDVVSVFSVVDEEERCNAAGTYLPVWI